MIHVQTFSSKKRRGPPKGPSKTWLILQLNTLCLQGLLAALSLPEELAAHLASSVKPHVGQVLAALAELVALALQVGRACHDLLLADGNLGPEELDL